MIQRSVLKRLVFFKYTSSPNVKNNTLFSCVVCRDDEARCWVYSKHQGAPQGSNSSRMIMEIPTRRITRHAGTLCAHALHVTGYSHSRYCTFAQEYSARTDWAYTANKAYDFSHGTGIYSIK